MTSDSTDDSTQDESFTDETAEQPRGRHRPRTRGGRIALGTALSLIVIASVWAAATFYGTWSRSDGEPAQVIVATWMRDNHLGPVVAQLEDLYYSYVDTPDVGGAPTLSADITAEDTAGLTDAVEDTVSIPAKPPQPEVTQDAGASESRPLPLTPVARDTRTARAPSITPSPEPQGADPNAGSNAGLSSSEPMERPHLTPPPPITSPVVTPEPKEGQWQPVASRVDGIPAIYVTRVRADDVHTSYYASVMWIDTLLTRAVLIPGYEEPGGPNPYDGALPEELWPDVLANVNGAFRLDDSRGGYYYEGTTVRPLVKGRASAVIYKDGSVAIGEWGRDLRMTPEVSVVRQNLDLIVDGGISQVSNGADNVVWGATTDKESLAWRAALGERADGSLVYVGSPYLSAESLADVLVGAGVERAIVLDMNNWWTAGFYFRHDKNGSPLCRKLDPAIQENCDRFLRPYKRDSFQFLARRDPAPGLTGQTSAIPSDAASLPDQPSTTP